MIGAWLRLVGVVLCGYPLAAALKLPFKPRLLAMVAIGLPLGCALTWLSGVFLPLPRPDLLMWLLSAWGASMLVRDVRVVGEHRRPQRTGEREEAGRKHQEQGQ